MGKREIACHEQFLLFPQCFQKACFPGASKGVIVWEWVNFLTNDNFTGLADDYIYHSLLKSQFLFLNGEENIFVEKGENTGYQHFLLLQLSLWRDLTFMFQFNVTASVN